MITFFNRNTRESVVSFPGVVGGDLRGSLWPEIAIEYEYIRDADFTGSILIDASLRYSNLSRCNFNGANLHHADMTSTTLFGCTFNGADLRGVNFSYANTNEADFTGAQRRQADPPIRGWKVEDGVMRRIAPGECQSCNQIEPRINGFIRSCGDCVDCCEHRSCDDCDTCTSNVCEHCDCCTGCCNCAICDSCNSLRACNTGDDCGYCGFHCSCSEQDEEEHYVPHGKVWHDPKPKEFRCSRLCGVEWEYNDTINLSAWRSKWAGGVHSDGSCGWEAVTAPMAGDYIKKVLGDLGSALKDSGTEINSSCGLHVHVDARDLSWPDMYRLLWVYAKVEPLLYLLAGQGRARAGSASHYCKPVGQEYLKSLANVDRKGALLQVALTDGRIPSIKDAKRAIRQGVEKKDGGRYRGLNIIPWLAGRTKKRKGKGGSVHSRKADSTVEFRMHKNTADANRVIGWTQLCVRLVEWCAKATDKEAQALPKSALRALCEVIAPDCAPWILSRVREWRKATKLSATRKGRAVPRYITLNKGAYALRCA